MTTLKKYDISGKEIGTINVEDTALDVSAHGQSIKDYIVAIRRNARQWCAHTKIRKEINKTGKKPHPQKGQGRSRQGCLAAPQYKGGGIVFGPRAKFDQHVRINRKERQAAIRFLIAEKIKENKVCVLHAAKFDEPKTAKMAGFFDAVNIGKKRVLVLGDVADLAGPLALSLRNLPRKEVGNVSQMNGYELARCQELVILEPAFKQFLSILT